MRGEWALTLFLVSYGNHYLRQPAGLDPNADADRVLQFVDKLSFWLSKPDGEPVLLTDNVAGWFAALQARGATHLSIGVPSALIDTNLLAFVGSAPLEVCSHTAQGNLYWMYRWVTGGQGRPWRVEYLGQPQAQFSIFDQAHSISTARANLSQALHACRQFSRQHSYMQHWVAIFDSAQDSLQSADPHMPYEGIVKPEHFPLAERQLLAAAARAYVFGGMGSWNDNSFDGAAQQEFATLTRQLFEAVRMACIVAANATAHT